MDLTSTGPEVYRQEITPVQLMAVNRDRVDLGLGVSTRNDLAARDPAG